MTGIDVNCMLGQWPFRKIHKCTFADLINIHKENNIAYGFVSSINSIFYNDPFEGDMELHNIIKDTDYNHILTVNPTLPGFREDIEKAIRNFNIKGVRVYPGYHEYKLNNRSLLELCDILKHLGLPLLLTMRLEDERLDYLFRPSILPMEEVGAFLSDNEGLGVLLLTFRQEELIKIKDVILANAGIYYDTSGLKNYLFAVEKSLADFGYEKMVYGSLHPLFCLKSTYFSVEKAELEEPVKERILCKNAEKLFV